MGKIDTLGPYAAVLGEIINSTAKNRTDIPEMKQKLEVEGAELHRGTGLLPDKI